MYIFNELMKFTRQFVITRDHLLELLTKYRKKNFRKQKGQKKISKDKTSKK